MIIIARKYTKKMLLYFALALSVENDGVMRLECCSEVMAAQLGKDRWFKK